MKLSKSLIALTAFVAVIAGCKKENEPTGDPSIKVNVPSLNFEKTADPQSVTLTSNRDWEVASTKPAWITVTPASGKASADPQSIQIAVEENTGEEREGKVTFSTGSATTDVIVKQEGATSRVYFNNFDKDAAVQTSDKWPYIYSTDCWKNQTGSGAANVTYITEGNKATIRNNSNSTGSGVNNIFFGSDARFCVKNIILPAGVVNYKLSFFGTRSVYGTTTGEGKSVFDHNVFKVYISEDGKKWVQVEYSFPGEDPDNAWAEASSSFTVPAGTDTLCIGIPALSETSTYRLDDVKLVESTETGTAIDFSTGIEIAEFKETPAVDPSKAQAKTVQEFITLADKTTYYKLTGSISSFNKTYCSFDLTDATGKIYVFSVVDSCKTKYSSLLNDGDEVTLAGKYDYYQTKHEVKSAVILSYKTPEHKTVTTDKVSEAIAAAVGDTVVLNGATVVAVANTSYLVTDATKTGYVLVFQKTADADTPVAIGDVVNVRSVRADYCSMAQLVSPKTTIVSSGATVTWPSPEDITSTFDSFTSTTVKYVSFKGQLTVNGNYYNVAVNGAQTNKGSLLPAKAADTWKDLPNTTFEGYYIYTSGSSTKYIYIIYTQATASTDPYLTVNPKSASVSATAGSTTINVSSNVDWTAESDNADFTVSPASGNGNGTITVTYPENTTESTKTANITVATATDTVQVAITQAKPGAATYTWTLKSGDLKMAAGTVTSGEATWAYTDATYIGWNTDKGVQIGSSNKPQASYTVSTESFSKATISSITVNASIGSGGDGKLSISVGGVNVLTNQALTTTATDYKIDGLSNSGKIEIKFSASSKAYYLKSVSVGY